ncbi:CaiB/BaiF CoA transferase family protein [Nocardioides sp. GXZ039]|uniref:CaiB/BaiF CoA transferase family protein n=1 Tax=Nocardioides sp. GXZ039 TaxID=3136018 RepID=UPI0030F45DE9
MTQSVERGLFSGIRVLDVATVLAGPVTATMLGDFGAEVVKIEEPGRGDFTRARAKERGGRSLQWLQEGRNKKSVALDLRAPEGREILRKLIPRFDVVITNFRPPTLEAWGLGPEDLQTLHPTGILVYLTAYGLTGPNRGLGAFDRIASAYSGLTYVSGEPDAPPVRAGYSVIDYMAGYTASFAVAGALYHREAHGGGGQVIDLALYEPALRSAEDSLIEYSVNRVIRERTGNRNPYIVPASDFTAADGRRVSVHAGTDSLFPRLAQVMDQPELAADERFARLAERLRNADVLYDLIARWVASAPADVILERCVRAGIPASTVNNVEDIFNDDHMRARGNLLTMTDEEHGDVTMLAPIPRMSKTPGGVHSLGPVLGAHTDAVLTDELGLAGDEIRGLRDRGVI